MRLKAPTQSNGYDCTTSGKNDANGNQKKGCQQNISKQRNQKLNLSGQTTKGSEGGVRPFRVRAGCIVATRYRSTKIQNVIRIVSSSVDGNTHSIGDGTEHDDTRQQIFSKEWEKEAQSKHDGNDIISPNNTMELWLAPQPGRDEGYALIGRQVRCSFRKLSRWSNGERVGKQTSTITNNIEGEVVYVEMNQYAPNSNTTDDKKHNGTIAKILVDESHIPQSKSFLNRFRVDDDNTNICEEEKKKRKSENFIRGVGNVILSVILPNLDGSKICFEEPQDRIDCLVVDRWTIKKRIPTPINTRKTMEKFYIGNKHDKPSRQEKNWKWIADKYHPYYTNHMSIGGSVLDPILLGKVLRTDYSTMSVTLQKMFLPEHTQGGRLSHHVTNEFFEDLSSKGTCVRDEGTRCGNKSSLPSKSMYILYEVPIVDVLVIGAKTKNIRHNEKKIPSNRMVTRYGYSVEKNVFRPTLLDSSKTNNTCHKISLDKSDIVSSSSPTMQICYRCRREEEVINMRQCKSKKCHGFSSEEGFETGSIWCVDCCQFLCDRGVFTMYPHTTWCCPCCVGICDCEEHTSCRAAQMVQTSFEESIKKSLHKVFQRMSSSEQNNLNTISKRNIWSKQPCSTCFRHCATSSIECMVCSKVGHKECFKWENILYQNSIGNKEIFKGNNEMENASKRESNLDETEVANSGDDEMEKLSVVVKKKLWKKENGTDIDVEKQIERKSSNDKHEISKSDNINLENPTNRTKKKRKGNVVGIKKENKHEISRIEDEFAMNDDVCTEKLSTVVRNKLWKKEKTNKVERNPPRKSSADSNGIVPSDDIGVKNASKKAMKEQRKNGKTQYVDMEKQNKRESCIDKNEIGTTMIINVGIDNSRKREGKKVKRKNSDMENRSEIKTKNENTTINDGNMEKLNKVVRKMLSSREKSSDIDLETQTKIGSNADENDIAMNHDTVERNKARKGEICNHVNIKNQIKGEMNKNNNIDAIIENCSKKRRKKLRDKGKKLSKQSQLEDIIEDNNDGKGDDSDSEKLSEVVRRKLQQKKVCDNDNLEIQNEDIHETSKNDNIVLEHFNDEERQELQKNETHDDVDMDERNKRETDIRKKQIVKSECVKMNDVGKKWGKKDMKTEQLIKGESSMDKHKIGNCYVADIERHCIIEKEEQRNKGEGSGIHVEKQSYIESRIDKDNIGNRDVADIRNLSNNEGKEEDICNYFDGEKQHEEESSVHINGHINSDYIDFEKHRKIERKTVQNEGGSSIYTGEANRIVSRIDEKEIINDDVTDDEQRSNGEKKALRNMEKSNNANVEEQSKRESIGDKYDICKNANVDMDKYSKLEGKEQRNKEKGNAHVEKQTKRDGSINKIEITPISDASMEKMCIGENKKSCKKNTNSDVDIEAQNEQDISQNVNESDGILKKKRKKRTKKEKWKKGENKAVDVDKEIKRRKRRCIEKNKITKIGRDDSERERKVRKDINSNDVNIKKPSKQGSRIDENKIVTNAGIDMKTVCKIERKESRKGKDAKLERQMKRRRSIDRNKIGNTDDFDIDQESELKKKENRKKKRRKYLEEEKGSEIGKDNNKKKRSKKKRKKVKMERENDKGEVQRKCIITHEIAKSDDINVEKLSKRKRKKVQKKDKDNISVKLCYACLFQEGRATQSQPQHSKETSTSESALTVLNATEKLLEMMPPIDFDLPFNFVSDLPEIRSDPFTEETDIKSVADISDVQEEEEEDVSQQSNNKTTVGAPKGRKNTKVNGSKGKITGRPKSPKANDPKEIATENEVIEEETNESKTTCSRIIQYTKQTSRNKNNSAEHARRAVALARSSGRRGVDSVFTSESTSSRATRAKQRGIRREIALMGKSNLGVTKQLLSDCEQSLRFGKSVIHGWGVFTDAAINCGDLIVEYRGILIGNAVADKREKEYENAKIGSDYMFRIDKEIVCDATHQGNVARFINASCSPNCHPRIITICGAKRIAIYAKRNIMAGEELCYDYKFEPEFDQSKRISCNCGAAECRGFMNWDKRYVAISPNSKLNVVRSGRKFGRSLK